jgi:FkbM family methyltransferase
MQLVLEQAGLDAGSALGCRLWLQNPPIDRKDNSRLPLPPRIIPPTFVEMIKNTHFARSLIPRAVRNWIRKPSRSLLYVIDRMSFFWGSLSVVPITEEWSVKCHPASRNHFEVFRNDPSQAREFAAFLSFSRVGMQLLDIGAHYGFFALAAIRVGGPTAKVLCLEPSPEAAKILRANVHANNSDSQVQVLEVAAGQRDEAVQMLTTGPFGADYLIVPDGPRADAILVRSRSIQSSLDETGFRPTHLKMDIEGCEYEVVEASIKTLSELKPILYLELHGQFLRQRGKDPAVVIENLRKAGYTSFYCDQQPMDGDSLSSLGFDCRLVCTA